MTKHTHGGHRPGAGRKPLQDGRISRVIRVRLSDSEYQAIIENTTPDSRRKTLLKDFHQKGFWSSK